jgi:hypothetical protein
VLFCCAVRFKNISKAKFMKKRTQELDVDFVGGQEPLTPDEEAALSAYFKQKKAQKAKATYSHTNKSVVNR